MEVDQLIKYISKEKKMFSNFDLFIKRSTGAISSAEFKRCTIINQLYHMNYVHEKTSVSTTFLDPLYSAYPNTVDDILALEIDPVQSKCVLAISRYNNITIFNVARNFFFFEPMMRFTFDITHSVCGLLNSVHWLWDGSVFSVGSTDSVQFWDTSTGDMIETIKFRTKISNHVMAASKLSKNKYAAATGFKGNLFVIDMKYGIIVQTLSSIEECPMKTLQWHPSIEGQYISGNDNGNIYLWDIRYHKKAILKYRDDPSFSLSNSHSSPVIGLRFYNYGHNIISVDAGGFVKSWDVKTGRKHPNYYIPMQFSPVCNESNRYKEYQFAITEDLKEDIAFFPSKAGLQMLDITNGKYLQGSHDTYLPITCATYDPRKYYVYAGCSDLMKLWSTDPDPYTNQE